MHRTHGVQLQFLMFSVAISDVLRTHGSALLYQGSGENTQNVFSIGNVAVPCSIKEVARIMIMTTIITIIIARGLKHTWP